MTEEGKVRPKLAALDLGRKWGSLQKEDIKIWGVASAYMRNEERIIERNI